MGAILIGVKYHPERVEVICEALAKGCTVEIAAQAAGISKTTYYEWQANNPEFADAVQKARAVAEVDLLAIIHNAAPKNWQAAAWILERTRPERYGRRDRVDVAQLRRQARELADELGLSEEEALEEVEALLSEHGIRADDD